MSQYWPWWKVQKQHLTLARKTWYKADGYHSNPENTGSKPANTNQGTESFVCTNLKCGCRKVHEKAQNSHNHPVQNLGCSMQHPSRMAQTPWPAAPLLRLPLTPTPAEPRDPDLNHSATSTGSDWQLLCPAPCNLFLVHLLISQYSSFSHVFKLSLAAKFLLLMMLQCKARRGQPQLSAGQGLPSLLCLAFVARWLCQLHGHAARENNPATLTAPPEQDQTKT